MSVLMQATDDEATVLEHRRVPVVETLKGPTAPHWAVHLAMAEVWDWWRLGAPQYLTCWSVVWAAARVDNAWQIATEELCNAAPDPRHPFFLKWVDTFIAKTTGMRVYPTSDLTLVSILVPVPKGLRK